MDISKSYVKDTMLVDELYYPNGERIKGKDKKPSWIEMATPHSDHYQEALARKTREEAKRNGKGGRAKNSGYTKSDLDDMVNLSIEFLADCTVNWGGWEEGTGENAKVVNCTRENAIKLYKNMPFVRKDVDSKYKDEADFYIE